MTGGHHVLEVMASRRHETLGIVLSVRTLAGLSGQHQLRTYFSGEGERSRCSKKSRNTALSSWFFGSTTRSPSYQGRRAYNVQVATISPSSSARSCLFLSKDIERRTECTKVHFRHFLSEHFRQKVGTRFSAEEKRRRLSGGSPNIASSF